MIVAARNRSAESSATEDPAVSRGRWFMTLVITVAVVVAMQGVLLVTVHSGFRQWVNEGFQTVAYFIAALCCGWASLRSPHGRLRWAWAIISVGFATSVVAELIYTDLELVHNQSISSPSRADAFYLSFYPLVALGILLLPSRLAGAGQRVKVMLDAAILVAAALALSLVFLLGPIYFQGAQSALELAVNISYPLGDLILLTALLVVLLRGVPAAYQPVYLWLVAGMLAFVYADSVYTYLNIQSAYVPGTPAIDPFWPAGALLAALAPLYQIVYLGSRPAQRSSKWTGHVTERPQASEGHSYEAFGRAVAPYLPIMVLSVLLWRIQPATRGYSVFPALELILLLVLVLIVARHILTLYDLNAGRRVAELAVRRSLELDALKDQFITSVNHELRTPLMTIQTSLETLRVTQGSLEPTQQAVLVNAAADSCSALVQMVQSILDSRQLAEPQASLVLEPVSVLAAFQAAIATVAAQVGEQPEPARRISLDVPSALMIFGNSLWLQQILTNLLANAVKYSAPGMPIDVRCHLLLAHGSGVSPLTPEPMPDRQMVEMRIRDYGLGIPAEQLPLLFHRFVRLPRDLASNVVGSGLGLYLCRELTERMEGRIWVESSGVDGEGSTFIVQLPAPPASVPRHEALVGTPEGGALQTQGRLSL
jgi:signal transduction histidine kinase